MKRRVRGRWLALAVCVPFLLLVPSFFGYFGGFVYSVATLPGRVVIDLLGGFGPEAVRNMIVFSAVTWGFWASIAVVTVLALHGRATAAVVWAAAVLGPMAWLCFRTTEVDGHIFERHFGMITHVQRDLNSDGRIDHDEWYAWSRPLVDFLTPLRSRSDANHDGLWDTWVDHGTSELRIDVDGDERPDVTLANDYDGRSRAKELRGY